jgi:hypothetical protein
VRSVSAKALVLVSTAATVAAVGILLFVALGPNGPEVNVVGGEAPTPTAAPNAPARRKPMPPRLFARGSVWNRPLLGDAPLDPSSASLVKKLRGILEQNRAAATGPWIQTNAGSTPLYVVPRDQPVVRVRLDAGAWAKSLQRALDSVPIPPKAKPAAGPDRHMTVWQPSKDRLWELFKARKRDDGWHASFGGAIARVSVDRGYYTRRAWPGLSQPYWGATATSLPVIAGTMRLDELEAGVIPHALAMNIPYARRNVHSWPAQRGDGASPDPQAIPEGAHFRLDPRLDIDRLHLPRMTRMMAVAAQRYGIIVRDQTTVAVAFFAEDATPTGTNPYAGRRGLFGGHRPDQLLASFPWEHLQLLKMTLRSR